MPLFLVRVTEKSPNVTVPVAVTTREYEVEAVNLTDACIRVVHAPVRLRGTNYVQRMDSNPYTRNYVEPDASRYAAVGISFPQDGFKYIEKVVAHAGLDPEAERLELATILGRLHAEDKDFYTIEDLVTCESSWRDKSPEENRDSLRHYVENEWHDEEVEGRSWFHELEARMTKTQILDTPTCLAAAKEAYWVKVGEIAAAIEPPSTPTSHP